MIDQPVLHTRRLVLRPFVPADAPDVMRLAGDRDVASTTATIPHPYPNGMAEAWIASHGVKLEAGTDVVYAITLPREEGDTLLVGAIGLILDASERSAEMGYWIGKPYWGRGYATEAARGIIEYGFSVLGMARIHAHHMTRNPASGRVLEKAGMAFEREIAGAVVRSGRPEDVRVYAIARPAGPPRSADRSPGRAGRSRP
jgi:RimJ/RimL family protein N-acetyltransferase